MNSESGRKFVIAALVALEVASIAALVIAYEIGGINGTTVLVGQILAIVTPTTVALFALLTVTRTQGHVEELRAKADELTGLQVASSAVREEIIGLRADSSALVDQVTALREQLKTAPRPPRASLE
jgi:hypothetical protein